MSMRTRSSADRPVRITLRIAAAALTAAVLGVSLVAPAEARPQPGAGHGVGQGHQLSRIELPDGFQPEGIAVGRRGTAYLGSLADGDIYAVNLRTGQGGVISQGPGTSSVGLKVAGDRLYVAGGGSGTGRVASTRTGAVLASYRFTDAPSFVNDVVLTRRAAYFTDSLRPQLYRVSYARDAARASVTTLPLTGEWVQTAGGLNANGIAVSPDGRSLLVVQTSTGFLFRVDPSTGVARRVDLGGAVLTNGDGLLVRGRTLYVVQNRLNQIAVLRLDGRATRGRLVDTLTAADLPAGATFDVPTTVAAYRGSLYLPNARFGTTPTPTTDYWITRIRP